jgi:ethanolamine transporter EutH
MDSLGITSLDPLLMASMILMQIGAKYLDLELTDFQKSLVKNNIVQAIILFGIIYIPIRDIFKTFIIVCMIYLLIHVLLNEKHRYNIYSKEWLKAAGIIEGYDSVKDKYYNNIAKIKVN